MPSIIPKQRKSQIGGGVIIGLIVLMSPPIVSVVQGRLIFGIDSLWLYIFVWILTAIGAWIWLAKINAFSINPEQEPPELRGEA